MMLYYRVKMECCLTRTTFCFIWTKLYIVKAKWNISSKQPLSSHLLKIRPKSVMARKRRLDENKPPTDEIKRHHDVIKFARSRLFVRVISRLTYCADILKRNINDKPPSGSTWYDYYLGVIHSMDNALSISVWIIRVIVDLSPIHSCMLWQGKEKAIETHYRNGKANIMQSKVLKMLQ